SNSCPEQGRRNSEFVGRFVVHVLFPSLSHLYERKSANCLFYFANTKSCQIVTDFLPSRSPALPFHTANATGTVMPGGNCTPPSPLGLKLRRKITRYESNSYTPRASTFWSVRGRARSVPNPWARRSSAALLRNGSETMFPAPQPVTKVGSDCSVSAWR